MFLTPEEVAELTGIKKGKNGKTREQLQVEQLVLMGVAHRVNARGRPIVTYAAVEGQKREKPKPSEWIPDVLRAA